jgi:hypothetical protein
MIAGLTLSRKRQHLGAGVEPGQTVSVTQETHAGLTTSPSVAARRP